VSGYNDSIKDNNNWGFFLSNAERIRKYKNYELYEIIRKSEKLR